MQYVVMTRCLYSWQGVGLGCGSCAPLLVLHHLQGLGFRV